MTYTKYEPADIEIYVKDKGLVLKEKSLVAFAQYNKKILGIGDEAEAIAAQNLESITVQSPLHRGIIADYVLADIMFRHMLQKAYGKRHFFKLNIFDGSYEKFKKEMAVTAPGKIDAYHVIIIIAKNEPEWYIAEELADLMQYAQNQGIDADRVREMLLDSFRPNMKNRQPFVDE